MKVDEIRKKYLDYFAKKGHTVVPSDSLVPQNDPTLLFTGAGMNQFKEYFLGVKTDLKRATSSQKCLRTGDLEEVGRTPFHHSFFEMLGNFSFGDYFNREAIHWAWEFLTQELHISPERLRISVHKDDEESYLIWKNEIKIKPEWIEKCGDKSNFWPSNAPKDGPNGPCGPCSEIYYDQRPNDGPGGSIEDDSGRFAEIWNLVFTQFDRQEGGKLIPLKQKNIDTGMGLERLACVLQSKETNYEIDSFEKINMAIENCLGVKVPKESRKNLYAISDHIRAIVFTIADGVIPSNEGRGYVVRKLIRRALWRAHELTPTRHLENPFLFQVVHAVVDVMHKPYQELVQAALSIMSTIKGEEERFLDTLDTGLSILQTRLKNIKDKMLPGEIVFELYDTYGFPDELTKIIAVERGLEIDQAGFDKLMNEQRKRAKDATQISGAIFTTSDLEKKIAALPATKFLGYDSLEAKAKILFSEMKEDEGVIVLDQTPFYGESGGQVGDQGFIKNDSFQAKVTDAQKKDSVILHYVKIIKGRPEPGIAVHLTVDKNRRERAMRNHTATHLLHAALRTVLGNQVRQLGSLVAPEKLRFDYSYSQAMTAEQMKMIEDMVNAEILKDAQVTKEEKPLEEAKKDGALAFFGEKYGKTVRVVSIPDFSKEFCGGTHCDRTGQIGLFVITSDSSIASGTRRIEALTGEGALEYARFLRAQVSELAQTLKTTPDKLSERVNKLQENLKKLEKQKDQIVTAKADPKKILDNAKPAGPVQFASHWEKGLDVGELRRLSDDLRSRSQKTVYFLGSENEDKIHFVLGVSHDLAKSSLDARQLAKELSSFLNASGGGRADLVQGGAPNQKQFQERWQEISDRAVHYLKQVIL